MDAMETAIRRTNAAIKKSLPEQILETPEIFDLDQLVYIIESLRTNSTPLGETHDPSQEAVRLRSTITMHQESGEINRLETKNTPSGLPEIYINTTSLAGINGPLPMPYTEMLLEQIKQKDFAGGHFLDIFHHRLSSMWHRLRKRSYPHLFKSLPAHTPVGKLLENLSGFGPEGHINHTLFFDYFWRKSRSLYGLLHMIKRIFKIEVSIHPFEGAWQTIDATEGSKIGQRGQFQILGKNAILGLRCWDQTAGFTIKVTGLHWEILQKFLPFTDGALGGSNFYALKQLMISYLGTLPRVFLKLALQEGENRGTSLNTKHGLGWNTWLSGTKVDSAKIKI